MIRELSGKHIKMRMIKKKIDRLMEATDEILA
jgi:hypothetical protein